MNELETIRTFLGWCTVINIGLLLFSTVMLLLLKDVAARLHARMFGIEEAACRRAFYDYLAKFKIAILVLNLGPYVALAIMT